MAYSIADALTEIKQEWDKHFAAWVPSWEKFCYVVDAKGRQYTHWVDKQVGTLASWNGTADLTLINPDVTHTDAYTRAYYADGYEINIADWQDKPGLIEKKAAELVAAAERTLESVAWLGLRATFSTTIDDGDGGTTAVCSAGHDLATGADQSNLLTSALSESALNTAIQRHVEWLSHDRTPMGLGKGPFVLAVAPYNTSTALKLTRSMTIPFANGTEVGEVLNPLSQYAIDVATNAYLGNAGGGDDDDWWLIDLTNGKPFGMWIPFAPTFAFRVDEVNFKAKMSCATSAKFIPPSRGEGVVGSNVA